MPPGEWNMSRVDDPRPPLPDWIMEAYTVICDEITATESGESQSPVLSIRREQAVDVLLSTEELSLEPEDIDYTLTQLLNRGYLYEVDDELRVTIPSEKE